jgi:hypothetical protein
MVFTVGFAIRSSFSLTKMIEVVASCVSNEAMEADQNDCVYLVVRIILTHLI